MSYWDSAAQKVITIPTEPWGDDYPEWERVDCHCCAGLTWHTGYDCPYCAGGFYAHHKPSGTLAQWPGGPLLGRTSRKAAVSPRSLPKESER